MELKGFYDEQVLDEMLGKGEINELEFIQHHSQEMIDDFKYYCQHRKIEEDNDAAIAYARFLLKRQQHAHTEGMD